MTEEPRAANIATVRALYDAFRAADVDAILAHLAAGATWTFAAPEDIPWGGVFEGRDGVRTYFERLFDLTEIQAFVIDAIVADGDRVVALGKERVRFKATGRVWGTVWAHAYTLQAGLVTEFLALADSAAVRSGTNPHGAALRNAAARGRPAQD